MVSLRAGEGTGKDVTRRERLRAIGLAEHLLTLVTRSRTALDDLANNVSQLEWSATALEAFSETPHGSIPHQQGLLDWVWRAKELCDDTCEAFAECRLLGELAGDATARAQAAPAGLERAAEVAKACKLKLDHEATQATWLQDGEKSAVVLSHSTLLVIQESVKQLDEVATSLTVEVSSRASDTTHSCLTPALERIRSVASAWQADESRQTSNDTLSDTAAIEIGAALDSVLAALLVAFQKLRRVAQEDTEASVKPIDAQNQPVNVSDLPHEMLVDAEGAASVTVDDEEEESPIIVQNLILRCVDLSGKLGGALALPKLNSSVSQLFEVVGLHGGKKGMEWVEIALFQLHAALKELADVAHSAVAGGLKVHHEMCRLEHTLVSLFQQLFARGFAKKPEDNTTEEGERGTEDVDGTGMGDGSGVKDVSEELENEEQLEGLKEEQKEKQDKDDKEESKPDEGVEMTNDFEGDLEDYKPPPEEEGKDEDEQEDEKEEVDRDMGDVGDDGEVVD